MTNAADQSLANPDPEAQQAAENILDGMNFAAKQAGLSLPTETTGLSGAAQLATLDSIADAGLWKSECIWLRGRFQTASLRVASKPWVGSRLPWRRDLGTVRPLQLYPSTRTYPANTSPTP